MKKLLLLVVSVFALQAIPVVYADEPLPEIAAVDEPAVPPMADNIPAN